MSIRTIFLTRRVGKEEEDAALLIIRRLLCVVDYWRKKRKLSPLQLPAPAHSAHPAPPALAPPRCCEPRPGGRSTCHPARIRPRHKDFEVYVPYLELTPYVFQILAFDVRNKKKVSFFTVRKKKIRSSIDD